MKTRKGRRMSYCGVFRFSKPVWIFIRGKYDHPDGRWLPFAGERGAAVRLSMGGLLCPPVAGRRVSMAILG
jgi:hypothetical protein